MFSLVWTMALLGALFSLGKRVKRPLLSTGLYVAMGGLVLRSALPWISQVSATGVTLLLAGGAAYTVGAAMFLLSSRLPLAHLVWRLFVMAGSGLHFFATLSQVRSAEEWLRLAIPSPPMVCCVTASSKSVPLPLAQTHGEATGLQRKPCQPMHTLPAMPHGAGPAKWLVFLEARRQACCYAQAS